MKEIDNIFTSVVIVAAGKGTRMNMDINKQYIEIANKPVLARTIQVFEDCELIKEIILVVNQQDILYCKHNIIDYYGFNKVKSLVAGGSERQASVYNGLLDVDKTCEIVLIHDGARPFVGTNCIIDSIEAAIEYGASCVAVPVKDTIKVAGKDGFIKETLERSTLWAIQTPQVFRHDLVLNAHKKAFEEGFVGTDDAVLVERTGVQVKLVMGSYENIKITTIEDLRIGEAIATREME